MQKIKFILVGSGFFWIFLWSVFGSLLGARINQIIVTGADPNWLIGVQKSLLTAAHSHMNNMAITLILMGISSTTIQNYFSQKTISRVCYVNLLSVPLFGIGLLMEAFSPSSVGKLSSLTFVVATGGILYMMTMALWSCFFFYAFLKSKP